MSLPNEKIANEVYDVLTMIGGANPEDRDTFVENHVRKDFPAFEWRFQGYFGFGGKFYSSAGNLQPWKMGYHPDDVDGPIYESLYFAVNTLLFNIWDAWRKS